MPPLLASTLTIGLIVYLFHRDFREKPGISGAIWLPTIWMLIIASRPVSWWLNQLGLPVHGAAAVEEGSSVDSLVYFVLIAAGVYVLSQRHANLSQIIQSNPWIAAFLLYCFLAVFWSDFPFVSLKRWIKILGHPIMVLVLFTEGDPAESLIRVVKRCAYVVFPVSILWIKYYPALGRSASDWGGMTNVGIAGAKNELGAVCLMLAISLVWYLLRTLQRAKSIVRRNALRLTTGLLLMNAYCFVKSDSATSIISLLLSIAVLLIFSAKSTNRRRFVAYTICAVVVSVVAQIFFNVYGNIITLSGHDSTIEGRERLWTFLLETNRNGIFGTGFESYWLGDRLREIWALPEFVWQPTQAHNGYLELYLNLGVPGLVIFFGVVVEVFVKSRQELLRYSEWGALRVSYLIAILAHNWTEAGFKGLSIIFLFFFIIAIKQPVSGGIDAGPIEESGGSSEESDMSLAEFGG